MEKAMIEKLIDIAIRQLDFSYSPYSGFKIPGVKNLLSMPKSIINYDNKSCGLQLTYFF